MEHINTYLPTKKEIYRFLAIAMILCLCIPVFMLGSMEVAYCDPTSPTTATGGSGSSASTMADSISGIVTLGASKIYSIFRAILIPIVIVLLGYNGLLLLGGSTQSINNAKKNLILILVGSIFIVFAPVIGQEVGTWLNNSSGYAGDLNSYNPLK